MNKVDIVASIMNKRPMTNRQVEEATQMLNYALNSKRNEIYTAEEKTVEKKYAVAMKAIASDFNKKYAALEAKLRKETDNHISLSIDSKYGNGNDQPRFLSVSTSTRSYNRETPKQLVATKEKIETMITYMKLGENLAVDVIAMVKEINSIK